MGRAHHTSAKASIYGGLIAPHLYTLAVCGWLGNQTEPSMASMGMLGYDNVRFPNPVRYGDYLTLVSEVIGKKNQGPSLIWELGLFVV